MERCNVLIAGAGPAGTSCAWKLHRAGLDVVVLDQAVFPREKSCAGWVAPEVFDDLALEASDYAQHHVLQRVTGFRTGLLDGKQIETSYAATVSYGVLRREFDAFLLKRCGARVYQGSGVESLASEGGRWVVNGQWEARILVGAGGHFCPVAQHLGARTGAEEAVVARCAEFEMDLAEAADCRAVGETPELFFCPDLHGYGWCFRKDNWLNVGLGTLVKDQVIPLSELLAHRLRETGRIGPRREVAFQGHAYLQRTHSRRKAASEGVLLVGDSAGLAHSASGEGIRPAVLSGLAAAETILDAGADPARMRYAQYEAWLDRHLGRQGEAHESRLPDWIEQPVARLLLHWPPYVRKAVLEERFLHPVGSR